MAVADVNPGERAALIAYRLTRGGTITATEIAERCGVSVRTARRDFVSIERVLPVRRGRDGSLALIQEYAVD